MFEIDIDLSEIRGFSRWCKEQPRTVRRGTAMMLNNYAAGTRDQAIKEIGRDMTVRNKRFVETRLQYKKTSGSVPTNQQRSYVGSKAVARFSGWTEQEYGTATARKRTSTLASRSGDRMKQMRPSTRLKPGTTIVTPSSPGYKPKGGSRNIGGFIAMVKRNKETRLIRIGKTIYKRNRDKLEIVQEIRKKQPKTIPWMRLSITRFFYNNNPQSMWGTVMDRILQPPKRY